MMQHLALAVMVAVPQPVMAPRAAARRWMVSYFGVGCGPGAEPPATGANTVSSPSPAALAASHLRYGTRGFLHLGLVTGSAGKRIWNVSCETGQCTEGRGCGFSSSGLLPGWESVLSSALDAAGPALANHSIAGVFLGDELSSTVNIPAANVSAVATAAKAGMAMWRAGGLVALNEGIWALNDTATGPDAASPYPRPTPCWMPRVPAAVDLFSFDHYACAAQGQPFKGVRDEDEPLLARRLIRGTTAILQAPSPL